MSKTKTNDELLKALSKANKGYKLQLAQKAGFKTVAEYKASLEGNTAAPVNTGVKETVHIVNILDVSGSMGGKIRGALVGINQEVKKLKEDTNVNYRYTLVVFSDSHLIKTIYDNVEIEKIDNISFLTGGLTALNQAVGETLSKLKKTSGEERVLVSIFTDGEENCSQGEFSSSTAVSTLIEECQSLGFTVTFIGTEYDVRRVVRDLKIDDSNTLVHDNTSAGIQASYGTKLSSIQMYSQEVSRGASKKELLVGFFKKTGKL